MDVIASGSTRHTRHTRRFIVSISLLFATGLLMALVALFNISQRLNHEQLAEDQRSVQRALDNRMAASRDAISRHALWAHAHAVSNESGANAEGRQVEHSLFTQDGYDGIFIQTGQRTASASVRGERVERPLAAFISPPPDSLTEALQVSPAGALPLSQFVLFEGLPAILTAERVTPEHHLPAVDPQSAAMLFFVDQLTPGKLQRLGRDYGVAGLTLVDPATRERAGPRLALDQTGFGLTWTPSQPGTALLRSVLPPLALAVLVLGALMVWFMRYTWRGSAQIDSSVQALADSRQALQASEERFRAVAEAASDWIWETDEHCRITYVSTRFAQVTGYQGPGWLGQPLEELLQCDTTPLGLWMKTLDDGQHLNNLRCSYRDESGQLRHCRLSARPIVKAGQRAGYRGTASDITDEINAHAQIHHLSMHDPLTGLSNRNNLASYLAQALRHKEQAPRVTLLLLDLDNFKPINDSLGHPAGDAVLLEVAARLRECTRDRDLVARLGGDEFVVALGGMQAHDEIERFCSRLLESLRQPVSYAEHSLHVGASIGIAQSHTQGFEPEELIRCADIALFQAKADGKNTWRYFAAQMNELIQARRQLENDLRVAVKQGQFVLHYQPRYTVDGSRIVSAEALVRWEHPVNGLLGPDQFIPLAEQTGLIVPLGRWVLEAACLAARNWHEAVVVSVNLSPAQFSRSDVVNDIRDILVATRLPAGQLELEITEGVMLNDIDGALSTMIALKELGVRLSMDDFGTGYSSLGYLRTYPFDGIKIDKRFISSMGNGSRDRAVVQAIINLGKAMGMTVTAEGVETAQQLKSLITDQCHEVQGFYLSRPVDLETFEALLQRPSPATLRNRVRPARIGSH